MSALIVRMVSPEQTRILRHAVLRPHQELAELAGSEGPGAVAVGAFQDGELIAVGLIGPDGGPGAWRIRGMATAPHARGGGAGSAVLRALVAHGERAGASRIWCNARTPALSLYKRAGFRAISEQFEIPDIGPHFVMERQTPVPGQDS